MDRDMEAATTAIEAMKEKLTTIVKDFPPYPVGSEDRVRHLREFAALRAIIERLTIPPDDEIRREDVRIGPSGLNIPDLAPPETVSSQSIEQALQQLDLAGAIIQERRDHLREKALDATGTFEDQALTGETAEARSIDVRTGLADQPIGLVHGSAFQLEQLVA